MMNGYDEKTHYDEEPPSGSFVKAFDAFPKSKPQYVTRTSGGGKWTVVILVASFLLLWLELGQWWNGSEDHTFSVEKGIGHSMQINLDIVVQMKCKDLQINVQDAAGDHIYAASRLQEDGTSWAQWVDSKGIHKLNKDSQGRTVTGAGWHDEGFGEEHVHDIVAQGRKKARWSKTPRLWGNAQDSCRIYGSLDLNKVQGDFHITARGHGYHAIGEHLDHKAFNFSHVISELSFGPYYPSLVNPLDRTINVAPAHFEQFQYFMSVVPTVYSVNPRRSSPAVIDSRTIFTNQYAVTESHKEIGERDRVVPGVFFKYDIEPILLTIEERRDGLLALLVKVINLVSGILVAGHWGFTISDWLREVVGRRRRRATGHNEGFIGAKGGYDD